MERVMFLVMVFCPAESRSETSGITAMDQVTLWVRIEVSPDFASK
jgi:hypothetical protein